LRYVILISTTRKGKKMNKELATANYQAVKAVAAEIYGSAASSESYEVRAQALRTYNKTLEIAYINFEKATA